MKTISDEEIDKLWVKLQNAKDNEDGSRYESIKQILRDALTKEEGGKKNGRVQ